MSTYGSKPTMAEFLKLGKRTYGRQKRGNLKQQYEPVLNQIAGTEIALIPKLYGDGSEVPVSYLRAFLKGCQGGRDGSRGCGRVYD